MELTDVQKAILEPFIHEMIESLDSMAGLKARAGDAFQDSVDSFRFKGYAIASRTHGKVDGFILMHNYIETAVAIGNKVRLHLLGDEPVISECERAGIAGYIIKPITVEDGPDTLKKYLNI